jgi:hypothetical protein
MAKKLLSAVLVLLIAFGCITAAGAVGENDVPVFPDMPDDWSVLLDERRGKRIAKGIDVKYCLTVP